MDEYAFDLMGFDAFPSADTNAPIPDFSGTIVLPSSEDFGGTKVLEQDDYSGTVVQPGQYDFSGTIVMEM